MGGSEPRKASPLAVVTTVLSAFFGVRKRSGHETETVRLSPVQIIVTGLVMAAMFVIGLILLVRFIISSAGS